MILTWFLPLEKLADVLQERYGVPVRYEDPGRMWDQELEGSTRAFNKVKQHSLTIPAGLLKQSNKLELGTLTAILELYHRQNPDQPRYRAIQTKLGFDILPLQIHDKKGNLVAAKSPFDTLIDVPVERRTPREHVDAFLAAVTAATGTPMESFNPYLDGYFAANGYQLRGRLLTPESRPYALFPWGSSGKSARDALIDLLDQSATSLYWTLHCGPGSGRPDGTCIFQALIMEVGPERRAVFYDRCSNCRLMPVK